MTDSAARRHDDTNESGLADDLLGSGEASTAETEAETNAQTKAGTEAGTDSSATGTGASTWSDLTDDEDYLAPARRRGKLTTGLLVALIFLVGILVGTLLTKALSPAPAPQIVYVLNDSQTPAPPVTTSTPR